MNHQSMLLRLLRAVCVGAVGLAIGMLLGSAWRAFATDTPKPLTPEAKIEVLKLQRAMESTRAEFIRLSAQVDAVRTQFVNLDRQLKDRIAKLQMNSGAAGHVLNDDLEWELEKKSAPKPANGGQ